jgi:hypothetical protein
MSRWKKAAVCAAGCSPRIAAYTQLLDIDVDEVRSIILKGFCLLLVGFRLGNHRLKMRDALPAQAAIQAGTRQSTSLANQRGSSSDGSKSAACSASAQRRCWGCWRESSASGLRPAQRQP